MLLRTLLPAFILALLPSFTTAQDRKADLPADVRATLTRAGYLEQDLSDLVVKDEYTTAHNGVRHLYVRQRWQGIEIWNGDLAIHRGAAGEVLRMNNGSWRHLAKRTNATDPKITADQALATVLALRDRMVPPTINLDHPEPDLGIDVAANVARPLPEGDLAAINNSFGFGGANVAVTVTNANVTR